MGDGCGDGRTTTLGTAAGREACFVNDGVSTIGDVALYVGNTSGIRSTLFNWVTRVTRALCTGSPASKLGIVVDGGNVKIEITSLAA